MRNDEQAADILLPSKRVPTSIQDSAPTKTDMASRALKAEWGVMNNPQARAAIAAVTMHYEYLDPLAGDIQVLGSNLYFSISAWMKELHNKVPLNCRRWLKRHATPEEYGDLALKAWERNPPDQRHGYVGIGSRLWHVILQVRPYKYGTLQQMGDRGFSMAEPIGPEDHWWFTVSEAWGEASDLNCDLTIAAGGAKLKADARVLDAMAIKRGQHEILQENFSLTVRGAKSKEQIEVMGLLSFQRGDPSLFAPTGDAGELPTEPRGFTGGVDADTKTRDLEKVIRQYAIDAKIPPRELNEVIAQAMATPEPQVYIDQEAKRFAGAATDQNVGTIGDVPFQPGETQAEGTMTPNIAGSGEATPPKPRRRRSAPALPPADPASDPLGDDTQPTEAEGMEEGKEKY